MTTCDSCDSNPESRGAVALLAVTGNCHRGNETVTLRAVTECDSFKIRHKTFLASHLPYHGGLWWDRSSCDNLLKVIPLFRIAPNGIKPKFPAINRKQIGRRVWCRQPVIPYLMHCINGSTAILTWRVLSVYRVRVVQLQRGNRKRNNLSLALHALEIFKRRNYDLRLL